MKGYIKLLKNPKYNCDICGVYKQNNELIELGDHHIIINISIINIKICQKCIINALNKFLKTKPIKEIIRELDLK